MPLQIQRLVFGSRSDSQPTLSRSIQPRNLTTRLVSHHSFARTTGSSSPPTRVYRAQHATFERVWFCAPLAASAALLSPPAPLAVAAPRAPRGALFTPFTWQAPSALRQLERYRCGGRSCLTRQPRTGTKLARLESALDTSSAAAAVAPAVGVVDGSAATHRRRPCSWRRCGQRERRRRSRRPCVPAVADGQASAPAFLPLAVVRRALLHSCRWRRSGELPFTVR